MRSSWNHLIWNRLDPDLRLLLEMNVLKPGIFIDSLINMAIEILAFSMVSFLVYYVNFHRRRIKILQGFLPICY